MKTTNVSVYILEHCIYFMIYLSIIVLLDFLKYFLSFLNERDFRNHTYMCNLLKKNLSNTYIHIYINK